MSKIKFKKYQKKLLNYELEYNLCEQINKYELVEFEKKLNQYKITTKLLFSYPNYYSQLKSIELNYLFSENEYIYKDIIWTHEHFEYIEEIRSIEKQIELLLIESLEFGFITKIQYKLAIQIFNSIFKIFESNEILKEFYINVKDNGYYNISIKLSHIDFFFNLIDIIILKINRTDKNINLKKIELLLDNSKYLNNIYKLKKSLETNKNNI